MHAVAQRSHAMLATVREDQNTMNESGIELARRVMEMGQAVAHLVASSAFDAAGGTPAAAATPTAPSTPHVQEDSKPTTPSSDWTKIMAGLGLPRSTDKKGRRKARKPKDKKDKGKAAASVAGAGADPGDGSSSDHTDSSSEQGGGGRGGAGRRDSDAPKRSSSEKRQTMFSRRTHQAALNKDKLLYTAVQPSTAHLYLRKLSLHSVWRFLNDTSEYMEKYGLEVLGATLIEPTIVEKLRADYPKLSKEKFFQLDNDGLYKVLQSKVKPLSVVEFFKMMETNVRFPELPSNYVPGASSFGPLHDALLVYKNNFRDLFEFMCEDNAENTPETRAKDKGLARTFVDKIPDKYGYNVVKSMKTHQVADIYEFLKRFYKAVADDHAVGDKARSLSLKFGGTRYDSAMSDHWRSRPATSNPVSSWRPRPDIPNSVSSRSANSPAGNWKPRTDTSNTSGGSGGRWPGARAVRPSSYAGAGSSAPRSGSYGQRLQVMEGDAEQAVEDAMVHYGEYGESEADYEYGEQQGDVVYTSSDEMQ
ncbi:hypothetical protein B484DRAFT_460468, partial [Ochromonadaceae sp. CCMP2298]